MTIVWLLIFWTMQIVAMLLFKFGSTSPARWLPSLLVGNLFGASSIWLLMVLYKTMNHNVAMAVALGGAFLLSQIALAIVFRSGLSLLQYAGVFTITVGMALVSLGARAEGRCR